jgi:hypothetical protein
LAQRLGWIAGMAVAMNRALAGQSFGSQVTCRARGVGSN